MLPVHYDALKEALRKDGLASSLKNIQRIRDAAIAKLFITHSANFIAYENTTIVPTLLRFAHGRILELGPGAGNQLQRFDASHITTIHGVEPNPHYASCIAAKLEKLGLRDSAFVGCSMTREIKADILDAGEWENPDDIEVGDDPYSVLPRIWGVLRKKA
ncbi:hypothetical protein SLS58_005769 [Diplodia intermedia]|uniref:Methyltransferase domain-containing protein n=1 Tax=Diplodia intermedia TaxID=856260 RepID=A0ABR3TQ21_9PEZI